MRALRLTSLALLCATAALAAGTEPVRDEKLSPRQEEDRSGRMLEKMKDTVEQVQKLFEQAHDEKDIVKLNCANEKLSQVSGLYKVALQAVVDLKDAVAHHDEEVADHSYAKLSIAGRKISQLRQDAQQCIGQLAFYNDEKTSVEVDVPTGMPADDPTVVNTLPPVVSFRPPPASGF